MTLGVWGYREVLAEEREDTMAAINAVLDSGRLILGEHVRRFESAFAEYCGVAHGVGVNSGTDALFLGLKALGVGPGDEVITVTNTAVPTVAAIAATGASARFVDIDPSTYLMDVNELDAAVTDETRCILPVHLYGQCVDMHALGVIAERRGIAVLEDCAQSHGAEHRGARAGSMSDLAAFSFYPTKILGGYGDGGMVVSSSDELDAKLRRLRFYGMRDRYFSEELGYNSRLDELHAAILEVKLARLDGYIARRRELASRYDAALADTSLGLPAESPDNMHAYYLYVARHPERDRLIEGLAAADVNVNISYPWPIHTMPAFADLGYAEGDLPHSEAAACEIFSLPLYPGLSDTDQDRVIETLLGLGI